LFLLKIYPSVARIHHALCFNRNQLKEWKQAVEELKETTDQHSR